MTNRPSPDRRRFLQLIGAAGLVGSLASPLALAQSAAPRSNRPRKPAPKPQPVASPAPDTKEEISEDARALASVIRRRYGKHLSREQLESVTRDLDGDLKAGQRLREAKLKNSDEPDFTFGA
ncbi:MAG TPA: twin-arginine translocation signal domain-containing protein [Candidatus Limnocylindria bacterium]|nr:twin-arginine translocation signal domain-containing protein [Candidatus Limnocylindria bacterium]